MRQVLVGAQVAASCALLIVAGLLVRALHHATTANPGFEFQQVVSIQPSLDGHGYSPAAAQAYFDTLRNRLSGLAGVESVAISSMAPLGNKRVSMGVEIDGKAFSVDISRVDPGFLHTMGIPLLRGRDLTRGDTNGVVVSDSLARRQWPGQDPLGKPFDIAGTPFTVIGVSRSARLVAPDDPDAVESFQLATLADMPSMSMVVKTSGPPDGLVPFLTSTARTLDPKLFPDVQILKSSFKRKLESAGQVTLAVGVLGLVALLLACVGIVGVVAYAVSQRTREIGLRMALGATPAHVLAVVLSQFSRPVALGLFLGIGIAAGLAQVLRKQLYGIGSLDPLSYAAAVALFIATVALAALLPARKALKIDPMRALRYD